MSTLRELSATVRVDTALRLGRESDPKSRASHDPLPKTRARKGQVASVTTIAPMKSVAEVTADGEVDWWAHERDGIGAVLAEHFGAELAGRELPE